MRMRIITALAGTCLAAADPTMAQDLAFFAGGEVELTFPKGGGTQELTLYSEAELNGFYAGAYGLVANDSASDEIGLYLGYRAETEGGFGYDLSYTRYLYPNDGGDCCGEIGLLLSQALGDRASVSADLTYDPDAGLAGLEIGAAYDVTDRVSVSVNAGQSQQEGAEDERTWDAGVSHDLGEGALVDLRYHDGNLTDGHLGLSLTFDTAFGR